MSVMLCPCIFCVSLLMYLFDRVCELFGETIYSAGSGMHRVQVVLSGFCMRLFCFV